MFSRVKNFFYRHRRKFLVGGAIVGGTYLLSRYVRRAIIEWHEREAKELLERTRKQQHYESIERTCNQTALTLAPNLKDTIMKLMKTDELIMELKNGSTNKIELWGELKILAFTKIAVLVYASSMLMITLRVQLNLIGGYMFRETIEDTESLKVSSGVQERYLCLCQYFISDGTKRLCNLIEEKVRLIIEDRSLKDKLTLENIEQIFWALQSSISADAMDPCTNLVSYILPENFEADFVASNPDVFTKIIAETKDLLECEEIVSLTSSCISRGFSYIMDQVAEYFGPKPEANFAPVAGSSNMPDPVQTKDLSFVNLNKVAIPLAKVIPIVNGLVQGHGSKNDIPHNWMQQLILMDILKIMGANVYETFSSKV